MDVWNLLGLLILILVLLMSLSRLIRRVTVFEYQHAIRFVRGKFAGVLAPGVYWILTPRSSIEILEARPRIVTIPGQELLSSDGVTLKVSLLLEMRITDPRTAVLESAGYEESLYAKAQAALREAIGENPIEEILRSRGDLAGRVKGDVEPAAQALGLELLSLTIKDIMFPAALKETFAQTARARQEAQALLERARGETAALRNLANSSRLFENHPNLFQLRLLQTAAQGGKVVIHTESAPGKASEPDEAAE